tara:strand:- start:137 stop:700 length:564 start_codon:yes stop_codon:yes gene_type:complete
MKFLERRSYKRAKKYSLFLKEHIEDGRRVLDIGLGDGTIAKQIQKDYSADVTGIDVIDYNKTDVPLTIYDGKSVNFKDNSFDVVLIMEVLHHCDDTLEVLKEAKRVAREKIIIFEDVYTSEVHKWVTYFYDFIMNIRHAVNTPFHFRNEKGWLDLFSKIGLRLKEKRKYPYNPFYCPMKTRMYVLEK